MSKQRSAKKAMLKNIIRGKKIGKTPTGASKIKLDGGLGEGPMSGSAMTGGRGSNLGKRKVF